MMMHLVARRYSHFRALTPPSGGLIHSADLILIWFLSANIIYDTSMKLEWYTVWIQAEVKPLLCRFDTQCCWSFSSLLHCSIASDCCCYSEVCYSADNINLILPLCTLASCLHPERFDLQLLRQNCSSCTLASFQRFDTLTVDTPLTCYSVVVRELDIVALSTLSRFQMQC